MVTLRNLFDHLRSNNYPLNTDIFITISFPYKIYIKIRQQIGWHLNNTKSNMNAIAQLEFELAYYGVAVQKVRRIKQWIENKKN